MYEDRTQDVIVEEMLSELSGIRTDENSIAYNACVKTASELEDAYGDISDIYDNMLPDTQDISHLIAYAKERGISYHYESAPVVRGSFEQEIETGEMFTCNDYTYTVESLISGYDYRLICETPGTAANANTGELIPQDYIDDYQGGEITEILVPGTDDEDTEVFRQRVIDSFNSTAFGGNKADYRLFVDAIDEVGGCKPIRRDKESSWIYIWIISAQKKAASEDLIQKVQTLIDPEQNHGEGDGMAPICHNVLIKSVLTQDIKVTATIEFDTGYSKETSTTQITDVVEDYFAELRKAWESNELHDTIVRLARIEAAILAVEGVRDISVKLNDAAENIILSYEYIPMLGGVEIV